MRSWTQGPSLPRSIPAPGADTQSRYVLDRDWIDSILICWGWFQRAGKGNLSCKKFNQEAEWRIGCCMFCLEESRAAGSTPDTADTADSICFALSKLPSVACCSKKIIAGSCSHWIYTHRVIKHNSLFYTLLTLQHKCCHHHIMGSPQLAWGTL